MGLGEVFLGLEPGQELRALAPAAGVAAEGALHPRAPDVHGVLPAVLVGDFNARPDATEIRFLCGLHALEGTSFYMGDCFDEVGEGPGYTYDPGHNPFAAFTHEAPRRMIVGATAIDSTLLTVVGQP